MKSSLTRVQAAAPTGSAQPFVPARLMPTLLFKSMTHSLRSLACAFALLAQLAVVHAAAPIAQWVADDWSGIGNANWVDRIGGKIATASGNPTKSSSQFAGGVASAGIVFDGVDDFFEVVAGQNPIVGKKTVTIVAFFKATQGATGTDGNFWQYPGPINAESGGTPNDFGLTYNSSGNAHAFFNNAITPSPAVSVIDG